MNSLTYLFAIFPIWIANTFGFPPVDTIRPDILADSRIIGGKEAQLGQFPFQVGLQIKTAGTERMGTCGGSLIAENFVVTAAHCVAIQNVEYINVHLGAHELKNGEEGHKIVTVPKENFKVHEEYNKLSRLGNDIALLQLPEKVELSDKVQTIALPTYSDANVNMEGKYLVASGWGRYSEDTQEIAQYLRFAEVRVENQRICGHYYEQLLPSMICTHTGFGKGPCHGDSGGPLTYTDESGQKKIVGLTSFGNNAKCVDAGWPSVFTRITSYLDWISVNSGIEIKP